MNKDDKTCWRFFLSNIRSWNTMSCFWHFSGVLEGLGSSRKLVGFISTYPGISPTSLCRNFGQRPWGAFLLCSYERMNKQTNKGEYHTVWMLKDRSDMIGWDAALVHFGPQHRILSLLQSNSEVQNHPSRSEPHEFSCHPFMGLAGDYPNVLMIAPVPGEKQNSSTRFLGNDSAPWSWRDNWNGWKWLLQAFWGFQNSAGPWETSERFFKIIHMLKTQGENTGPCKTYETLKIGTYWWQDFCFHLP